MVASTLVVAETLVGVESVLVPAIVNWVMIIVLMNAREMRAGLMCLVGLVRHVILQVERNVLGQH